MVKRGGGKIARESENKWKLKRIRMHPRKIKLEKDIYDCHEIDREIDG